MNKLIGILSLILLLTIACKEEVVEVVPVEEVTPAVEEVPVKELTDEEIEKIF